jgi:hypothetical protein
LEGREAESVREGDTEAAVDWAVGIVEGRDLGEIGAKAKAHFGQDHVFNSGIARWAVSGTIRTLYAGKFALWLRLGRFFGAPRVDE